MGFCFAAPTYWICSSFSCPWQIAFRYIEAFQVSHWSLPTIAKFKTNEVLCFNICYLSCTCADEIIISEDNHKIRKWFRNTKPTSLYTWLNFVAQMVLFLMTVGFFPKRSRTFNHVYVVANLQIWNFCTVS